VNAATSSLCLRIWIEEIIRQWVDHIGSYFYMLGRYRLIWLISWLELLVIQIPTSWNHFVCFFIDHCVELSCLWDTPRKWNSRARWSNYVVVGEPTEKRRHYKLISKSSRMESNSIEIWTGANPIFDDRNRVSFDDFKVVNYYTFIFISLHAIIISPRQSISQHLSCMNTIKS
jgi:hypothetical protein